MNRFFILGLIVSLSTHATEVETPLFSTKAAPSTPSPQKKKKKKTVTIAPVSGPSAIRETQEEAPIPTSPQEEETRLTKNWGGARKKLSDLGIDVAMIYKGNIENNLSGGIKSGADYFGNLDIRASLDGEKIAGMKGTSAFVYFLMDHGGHPSQRVGDIQGTNNVETSVNYSAKLYEAWVQQLFHEDKISILIGLHDLNSEFYVTDTSGLFLNGSFGTGKELSQTGKNGPSIFPATSPALRFRVEPSKLFYMQFAIFDALSGNPTSPQGTHINLNASDGLLMISEFAYLRGKLDPKQLYGKYGFGFWSYTKTFDHLVDTVSSTPVQANSNGAYFIAEQNIFENFAVFFRYGVASTTVNRFGSNLSFGAVLNRFGLAYTQVNNGPEYLTAQHQQGIDLKNFEGTFEASYRFDLLPGIALQPDVQYIIHPNTNPLLKNALAGTFRFELNL